MTQTSQNYLKTFKTGVARFLGRHVRQHINDCTFNALKNIKIYAQTESKHIGRFYQHYSKNTIISRNTKIKILPTQQLTNASVAGHILESQHANLRFLE